MLYRRKRHEPLKACKSPQHLQQCSNSINHPSGNPTHPSSLVKSHKALHPQTSTSPPSPKTSNPISPPPHQTPLSRPHPKKCFFLSPTIYIPIENVSRNARRATLPTTRRLKYAHARWRTGVHSHMAPSSASTCSVGWIPQWGWNVCATQHYIQILDAFPRRWFAMRATVTQPCN